MSMGLFDVRVPKYFRHKRTDDPKIKPGDVLTYHSGKGYRITRQDTPFLVSFDKKDRGCEFWEACEGSYDHTRVVAEIARQLNLRIEPRHRVGKSLVWIFAEMKK